MSKTSDIKIKDLVNDNKILGASRYEFNLKGADVSTALVNTLRRTIWSDVPIYYFEKVKIIVNTSVYNNDYLTLRIKNLPILKIENKELYCEKIYSEDFSNINDTQPDEEESFTFQENIDNFEIDILDSKENISIDTSILSNLTIYCNTENKEKNTINVTTDDCKFYFKQKEIPSPFPEPVLLLILKPGQKINFSAVSSIGCERISAEQAAVSVCGYKEISITEKINEFIFFLESKGQNTEKEIMYKAIKNILRRLEITTELINKIPSDEIKEEKIDREILLQNLDINIIGLIVEYMENLDVVDYFGYTIDTPLKNNIIIKYKLLKKNNIKELIFNSIAYWEKLFNNLIKLF